MMTQRVRKNIQVVFPACIHTAVMMGLMLLGMSSCGADGSVTPDLHPASTQSRAEQETTIPLSNHAMHAETTGRESLEAQQADETVKPASLKHKSVKDHAKATPPTVDHDKSDSRVKKPAEKPFNMDVLIERLKKTDAIGMFSKLVLRSDALDLMDMVKAYNKHRAKYSMKELRARFNGLVLKVLALLNDDPKLARDISLARECIWRSLLEVRT